MLKHPLFASIVFWTLLCEVHSQIIIGTGPDTTHVVIEAVAFGSPLVYQYRYTYDQAAPPDAYQVLKAISDASADLEITFLNFSPGGPPSYFIDSITYLTTPLAYDGESFWAQWVSGGRTSVTDINPPFETTFFDATAGVWTFGNGISAPFRLEAPGSWDGLIFNDGTTPPSVAPIPEPATAALIVAGGGGLLYLARRRRAT